MPNRFRRPDLEQVAYKNATAATCFIAFNDIESKRFLTRRGALAIRIISCICQLVAQELDDNYIHVSYPASFMERLLRESVF